MAKKPKTDGEDDMDAPGINGYKRGGMVKAHKPMKSEMHGHKPISEASRHGHKPMMKKPRGA